MDNRRPGSPGTEGTEISAGAVPRTPAPERLRGALPAAAAMKYFAFGAISGLVYNTVAGGTAVSPFLKAALFGSKLGLAELFGSPRSKTASVAPLAAQLAWALLAAYLLKKWEESSRGYEGEPNLELA